jgi:hypothetical protein
MRKLVIAVIFFCMSTLCFPFESAAQQPTATISALSGTVLVNGQPQGEGTVLRAGDIIKTQAGSSVVLELSDGSQLELGENTQVDIAELSQTATGARRSRVKLAWGWIRARLSPGHQKEGSSFNVETPNALVGVKFSDPRFEVSYDPVTGVTTIKAFTVTIVVIDPRTGQIIGIVHPGQQATVDRDGNITITPLPRADGITGIQLLFQAVNRGVVTISVPQTPSGTLGSPDGSPNGAGTGLTPGTRQEGPTTRNFRINVTVRGD